MIRSKRAIAFAAIATIVFATGVHASETAARRIVSIGGAITETIFLLGAGARIVAVDETSLYPAAVEGLPNVGYPRSLSPEPILALKPDLIIYSASAGPPETFEQLTAAGVRMVSVADEPTVAGTTAKVRMVAKTLGMDTHGEDLVRRIETEIAAAAASVSDGDHKPRVLFVMQFDQGSVLAAGTNTAADSIIRLAGGLNAADGFARYKPMGAEALLAARPDVIVTMPQALEAFDEPHDVLALPSLALTPAARHERLVVMDGLLLLGFGPRLGEAVRGLASAIGDER